MRKKKIIIKICTLILGLGVLVQPFQAAEKTLLYGNCDVNGDGKKEYIYIKTDEYDDFFLEDSYLLIRDSTNKKELFRQSLGYCNTFGNTLNFCDFTNDGIKDIMIKQYIGGTDCNHTICVFQYANGSFKELGINVDEAEFPTLEVKWINNKYYLEIKLPKLNKKGMVDLSNTSTVKTYIKHYPSIQERLDALNMGDNQGPNFMLEDFEGDGKLEVVEVWYINGVCHGDKLATAKTYLKYNKTTNKWESIGVKGCASDSNTYVVAK